MRTTIKFFVTISITLCMLSCKTQRVSVKRAAGLYGRNLQQYIRLTLSDDSGRTDENIISFKNNALPNFDIDEDGLYNHSNAGIGLWSMSGDGVPLQINVMPFPGDQPEVIRLDISANQESKLKLQMTEIVGIPDYLKIKLVDRFENLSYELHRNSAYVFNSGKGRNSRADAHRFILVIYRPQYYSFQPEQFYNKKDSRNWTASTPVVKPGEQRWFSKKS